MTDPTDPADAATPLEARAGAAYRDRLGQAPPAVADAAVVAFRRTAPLPWGPARVLLVIAAAAGVLMDLPVLLGAADHSSVDVAALHVALGIGLALAAWRPDRHARGLTPVIVAAAVMLLWPAADAATGPAGDPLEELSHLPVVLGAAALLLGGQGRGAGGRRRTA